jgi:dienelactone hydrolase
MGRRCYGPPGVCFELDSLPPIPVLAGAAIARDDLEGAPHSFFDRRQEQFAEASEDAWQRVLAFIDRLGTR